MKEVLTCSGLSRSFGFQKLRETSAKVKHPSDSGTSQNFAAAEKVVAFLINTT